MRVAVILGCYRQGMSVEEIVQQYPSRKPADVHDALAYAYDHLADDDHGPLALQEILLAGFPAVGVGTGASFVTTDETGGGVGRLPSGRRCVETERDERALAVYLEAIRQAQTMDREAIHECAREESRTDHTVKTVITALANTGRSLRDKFGLVHR